MKQVLQAVGLATATGRVAAFSTGMQQRLGLAASLIGEPELLILDEPTAGLDPHGVREVRERIRALADEGCTVLLSSHQLLDVELLCSRVLLITDGAAVRYGALPELLRGTVQARAAVADPHRAVRVLHEHGISADVANDQVVATTDTETLLRVLTGAGIFPSTVSEPKVSLETLFLEATRPASP